jgi:dipeptidase
VVQLVLQDYKETMAQQDQLAQQVEACRVSRVQQDLLAHVASKVMQVLQVQLQMLWDQLVPQVLLEQDQLVQEDLKVTQEIQDQLAHQEQVLQVSKDLAELKVK